MKKKQKKQKTKTKKNKQTNCFMCLTQNKIF